MNILVITATYPPSANGVAVSTKRTVTALRKLGHRVVVYGPKRSGIPEEQDYIAAPTIRIPLLGISDYPIAIPHPVAVLCALLPDIRWDIIHVHHPVIAGPFAVRMGKKLGVPVVFTYHTRYDQYIEHFLGAPLYFRRWLYRWLYEGGLVSIIRSFDGVIATTRWLKTMLTKTIPGLRVYYASTAGLTKSFFVRRSKQTLRRTLGLSEAEPVFLSVSRLSKEKRTDILLRGFLHWADTHDQGILVMVGDGGNRSYLESLSRASVHHARVRFVGKILNDDLPQWYSCADIFLYSSITDTIGINILEAMSAGLPVVAPDHLTTREIIVPGANGQLYKGNESGMAKAIDTALRYRNRLARGAFHTAKGYDVMITIRQLLGIYETLIRQYKRHT